MLESSYEAFLVYELNKAGLNAKQQIPLPVVYKDIKLNTGYRLDLVVEDKIIVELKSVDKLMKIHESQLITYLKLSGFRVGLLINFNVEKLVDGIVRRIV